MNSIFKSWLKTSLTITIIAVALFFSLPAILLLLQVPSFSLGSGRYWITRWQNEPSGSGLELNLALLLIAIAIVATISLLARLWQSRRSPQ
ncbi:MAG: hypothetical protein F6J97_15955 [Leptolyngbya sp. SIO4C1]|nr:hypothetical protein [Leptolyngbya sp. SIO4C1]